jgi:hypothetical protein
VKQSCTGGCHCGAAHRIHHLFCSTCGIESYARGKSADGADMVAINLRCLDNVDSGSFRAGRSAGEGCKRRMRCARKQGGSAEIMTGGPAQIRPSHSQRYYRLLGTRIKPAFGATLVAACTKTDPTLAISLIWQNQTRSICNYDSAPCASRNLKLVPAGEARSWG